MGQAHRRAAVAAAWFVAATSLPALVQAQAKTTRDAAVAFDIPSQPMASALNAWAVQADAQLFVEPGPVAHLVAPAVKGTLAPRQALRALLAHSNLMVTRGTDGVFVIKPRPVVAAAPAASPAPMVEAPPPLAAAAPPPTVREGEGPWLLRLDVADVSGNDSASGGATATLGGEYFLNDHVAGELAVTLPRTYGYPGPGSARLLTSTLTLKYYFAPVSRLRPYFGAGLDFATQYDVAGVRVHPATIGVATQAGIDVLLTPHWMLNADASWVEVRAPLRIGLGVSYRFQ